MGAHQVHYRHTLEKLGKEPGRVGIIFRKAQNKLSNHPTSLWLWPFSGIDLDHGISRSGKPLQTRNMGNSTRFIGGQISAFLTTHGVTPNAYAQELVQGEITTDQLFT